MGSKTREEREREQREKRKKKKLREKSKKINLRVKLILHIRFTTRSVQNNTLTYFGQKYKTIIVPSIQHKKVVILNPI